MKHFRALTLIGLALIGAMVIDYLAPWPYIMTPLYAIPVLIAAYRLPPRGVAVIAGLATAINLISGLLEGTPLDVVLLYTSGLLITGYLAIALARQRQEIARYAGVAEQHAQAAELARQRLQEFLAMVVHDLRNPLAAILGSLQVLQRPAATPSSAPAAGVAAERGGGALDGSATGRLARRWDDRRRPLHDTQGPGRSGRDRSARRRAATDDCGRPSHDPGRARAS
jgi:signal transduction histidine kinase